MGRLDPGPVGDEVETCFSDYTVTEYLLGVGPTGSTKLRVAYHRMGEAYSYELYRLEHDAEQFGNDPLLTRGEHEALMLEQWHRPRSR